MLSLLTIILVLFFAPAIKAQVPTPVPSATPASTTQISQAPTTMPTSSTTNQSTTPPAQSSRDVVLGRSYKDIQDNYRKIQEQRKLAQEQQIQAAKAQAAAKSAATTKAPVAKNTSPATSQATTTMSPQEYYWQQQLERQQLKAGIQRPESISSLEKRTYAGLKNAQVKPAAEKSTIKKTVAQTSQSQSSVQEGISLARKKATDQQKKRKKKIGRTRRLHPKNQKASMQTPPATTTETQDQTAQTKTAQLPNK